MKLSVLGKLVRDYDRACGAVSYGRPVARDKVNRDLLERIVRLLPDEYLIKVAETAAAQALLAKDETSKRLMEAGIEIEQHPDNMEDWRK